MTDYTRNYDFSAKDALITGNPSKLIKGSEIDDEFDALVTSSATKATKVVPSSAGNVATLSITGELQDGGAGGFPAATAMLFYQSAAPTGWTKTTTAGLNDHALRVMTSGTWTDGTQGTSAFSTVFGLTATDSHTLTAAQSGLPSHTHSYSNVQGFSSGIASGGSGLPGALAGATTGSASANASSGHTHNMEMRVKYLDFIIATKDA